MLNYLTYLLGLLATFLLGYGVAIKVSLDKESFASWHPEYFFLLAIVCVWAIPEAYEFRKNRRKRD